MVSCSGSLVPWRCWGGGGWALLSQSTLLRLPAALYGAGPALRAVPALRCSTKAQTRLRLYFVPSLPEQLRQSGALPGCSVPSPLCGPSLFPPALVGCMRPVSRGDPPGGCRPSRISGSLWLETGGLFAVW